MKHNQSGFSVVIVLLAAIIIIAIGVMGWYVYDSLHNLNATYSSATSTSNKSGPKFGSKGTTKNIASLSGVVTEGPTSPLTQSGTPSDAPVTDHIIQAKNAQNQVVTSVKTDSQGKYEMHLSPGNYALVLDPKVGLADPPNNTVLVKSGDNTLNLSVDTGIR